MPRHTEPQKLSENTHVSVIGLGYVGLPLAVAFGSHFKTSGFDSSEDRIEELYAGVDKNLEIRGDELIRSEHLRFTSSTSDLSETDVFVVTVPTPIDHENRPDLSVLENATRVVGSCVKSGNVIIFESTVYPGATEEFCVPIIEEESGLKLNIDFFVGYSPERINPGDPSHRLADVIKVTSGSTPGTRDFVDALYRTIVQAGTHSAPSIRVAEAAKVIENTQRDLNIALINELAIIFDRLGIDTEAVLDAAATKWNFLSFKPGLVGGHCIGVDPYYLTHRSEQAGYRPEIILAGRRINDGMGTYIAQRVLLLMRDKGINPINSRTLVMGLTFKENCLDARNTKVVGVVDELIAAGSQVDVYDPYVNVLPDHIAELTLVHTPANNTYDAIVIAVAHDKFRELGALGIQALGKQNVVIFDVKHLLPADQTTGRL